jgi:hypothetical protein
LATARQNTLTIGDGNTGDILLAPDGTNAVSIKTGGNVGIGTTSQSQKLQVGNYSGSNVALVTSGTSGGNKAGFRTQSNTSGGVYWDLMQDGSTDVFQIARSGSVLFTIDSAGNLGIGQTTPIYKLDVTGNLRLTGTTTLGPGAGVAYTWPSADAVSSGYTLTSNGAGLLSWSDPADATSNYWKQTLGALYPKNSTVDFFIGGTSTVSAKFAVLNMNTGIPVASIAGNFSLGSVTGTTRTIGATSMNPIQLGDATTGDVIFAPANTVAATIKVGGNVGIGTSTPAQKLQIGNWTGSQYAMVTGGTSGGNQAGVRLQSGSSGGNYYDMFLNGATNVLTFGYNGADKIYMDTNGNLGIGNSAPAQKLDVAGSATISATLSLGPIMQSTAGICTQSSAGKFYYDGPANSYYYCNGTTWLPLGSGSGGGSNWTISGLGVIYPNNATVDLLVGGTATASAKFAILNMVGSGSPTASVSSGLNGTGMYMTADGNLSTTRRQSLSLGNTSSYNTTGNILLHPNGVGNVGIGTTGPAYTFDLSNAPASSTDYEARFGNTAGSSNGSGIIISDLRAGGESLVLSSAGTGSYISATAFLAFNTTSNLDMDAPSNERMRIDTNGNVGIGTTGPVEILEVEKNTTSGYVFLGGVTGGQQVGLSADTLGGYLGTKSNNNLGFFTNNGATQMLLTTAGNLGIGNTTPLAKLDVAGAASVSGNTFCRDDAGCCLGRTTGQVCWYSARRWIACSSDDHTWGSVKFIW